VKFATNPGISSATPKVCYCACATSENLHETTLVMRGLQMTDWKLDHIGVSPSAESYLVLHRFGPVRIAVLLQTNPLERIIIDAGKRGSICKYESSLTVDNSTRGHVMLPYALVLSYPVLELPGGRGCPRRCGCQSPSLFVLLASPRETVLSLQ